MADSELPSSKGVQPSSDPSSAAAAPDWEMLSMSMSSSALGKPRDDFDHDSEKSTDQKESSGERSLKDGGLASDAGMDPFNANVRRHASTDADVEPFTEGWKPHSSSSSGLYEYGSDQGRQEEPRLPSEASGTYTASNEASNVLECLFFSEKDDADVQRKSLDRSYSVDEIQFPDVAVNGKIKRKGAKPSQRFSNVAWAIAMAASVAGIIFLGNRLRLAYNQNQQLEIQLSAKDEKLNEMLVQVNRLKQVLGNHHKVPLLRD